MFQVNGLEIADMVKRDWFSECLCFSQTCSDIFRTVYVLMVTQQTAFFFVVVYFINLGRINNRGWWTNICVARRISSWQTEVRTWPHKSEVFQKIKTCTWKDPKQTDKRVKKMADVKQLGFWGRFSVAVPPVKRTLFPGQQLNEKGKSFSARIEFYRRQNRMTKCIFRFDLVQGPWR